MKYGLPYQGSKNDIAEWVMSYLPPSHTFVDLFAGGCAVTHAAMLSGKFERFVANDITDVPQVFADAIAGEFDGYCTVPTRAEFNERRDDDTALAILYSFGNGMKSYLWGSRYEDVKVHASRMLSMPSMHERRVEYAKFCKALQAYLDERGAKVTDDHGKHMLMSLEGLERLKRLQGLERLEGLERLQVTRLDYRAVDVPDGATVYADPPYRSSCRKGADYGMSFDADAFDEWLASVEFPVVVSEYSCPRGCVEIAAIKRKARMNDKSMSDTIERLFVQEHMQGEYERRMVETRLFA